MEVVKLSVGGPPLHVGVVIAIVGGINDVLCANRGPALVFRCRIFGKFIIHRRGVLRAQFWRQARLSFSMIYVGFRGEPHRPSVHPSVDLWTVGRGRRGVGGPPTSTGRSSGRTPTILAGFVTGRCSYKEVKFLSFPPC